MFVDRTEIVNAAKALRASQEESKYSKLVALANKQLKAMQAAIQKGKEEFETRLVLDITEDNPQAALEPRAQRLADDLRAQGYTATVTTFADVSTDRKDWTPNITVVIGLGDMVSEVDEATAKAKVAAETEVALAGEAVEEMA
ncbi:MAG: hypothetical protein CL858_30770 [Cupriavidus sp.]|jgi:hypothetical protein|uniref:hypothetical protein n=1 Tax=Cupriavidus pauculus TaxID=82633 RepID=UPI000782660D|nr:hypothetical protein [Cupriavidus pauculus]MBU69761.1 hypothetical protein [Cupriavidus sp.]KAB0601143.1 hypothetical protein F7R19_17685 [Cupriavidus pauculus]MBY4729575.1 hypothetical protein [Cupriavidus pauculus]MCM3608452.1 hypothetical protein [Cupriavidus pauculus]UAK99188.1 hypothetical protein K8O84_14470 [Cupriavidus pauculus]